MRGREKDFLKGVYYKKFHGCLGIRKKTFECAFSLLQEREKRSYLIIETGVTRKNLKTSLTTGGASTYLFDSFVNYYGGKVYSIDIDRKATEAIRAKISNKTKIICNDSLVALAGLSRKIKEIDLLYLDSVDLNWLVPKLSSSHILKEFKLVEHKLKSGCLAMVDDSPKNRKFIPPWIKPFKDKIPFPNGKGMSLISYLRKNKKFVKVIHEYQVLWKKV